MSKSKAKVAVIGLGNIGKVLATNLVKGDRDVIIASRKIEDAKALSEQLSLHAKASDVVAAIKEADIVILSIWFSTIQEFLKQYATELQGKIIIDPSNPIAPDGNNGFKKIIGAQESAGEIISHLLPKGARLVKALGTLGAASLQGAAHTWPKASVLFYATDDKSIDPQVEELIQDVGFEAVRVGGIDQSIRLEVFGQLHEFGALGKTITLQEYNQLT